MFCEHKHNAMLLIIVFCIAKVVSEELQTLVYSSEKLGDIKAAYIQIGLNKRIAVLGIPYAIPPVDDLRFQPPQPHKIPLSDDGETFSALTFGARCVTHDNLRFDEERNGTRTYAVHGDEDCLFLNIYTSPKAKNRPVAVYLHDGGFSFGDGKDGSPTYLLEEEDIVLVTVNYRLGPFGFLSTGDNVVPGNMGLKDQVLALKWIQEHISTFGGDPTNVGLVGAGAGGASAHLHFFSPLSKGLFHKAYSSSGNALMPNVVMNDIPKKTRRLASTLGCPTNPSRTMVQCLRLLPTLAIAGALQEFKVFMYSPFTIFGPTVEQACNVTGAFLTKTPRELYEANEVQDLPWITGFTSRDGLYNVAEYYNRPDLLNEIAKNWDAFLPHIMFYESNILQREHAKIAKALKNTYLGGKPLSIDTRDAFLHMVTDRLYGYPTLLAAKLQARINPENVWVSHFSYAGKTSTSNLISQGKLKGPGHAEDMAFIFPPPGVDMRTTFRDKQMSLRMVELLSTFLHTGAPPMDLDWLNALPGDEDNYRYMEIAGSETFQMLEDKTLVDAAKHFAIFSNEN